LIARVEADRVSERARWRRWVFPNWEERKRLFIAQAWVFVPAAYLAVLFALALPQRWRAEGGLYVGCATAAFLIRTFMFHLGFILALIVAVAAWMRRWRLVACTLPLWIACQGPALLEYWPKPPPPGGTAIKIMSVNLLGCNKDTAGILAEVEVFQPDVLTLQEYRAHWHAAFQAALRDSYPYFCYQIRDDDFGQALYSRLPFARPAEMDLPLGTAGTPQTRAVLRVGEREAAVYSIHLMPPKSIEYARRQRGEFADLLELLAREERPAIVCGDFNFTNDSPFADDLARAGLTDVHHLCGVGRGATWPVLSFFRYLPGLRLDHVFLTEVFGGAACGTGIGRGSDHRPITAVIVLRGEK
jgi:endonuclease/exonuclease/phosphatase (EEP) superfamily protein YafD